jgi:hypothetical protein
MRDLEIKSDHLALPVCVFDWLKYAPVDPKIQLSVFEDISAQLIAGLERGGNPLQVVRLMAQAEKLLGIYVAENFHNLAPLQLQLQRALQRWMRTSRRIVIHKILTAKEPNPRHRDLLNAIDDHDEDTAEDWRCAVAAVDEARDLFFNLRGRDNEIVAQERREESERKRERERRRAEALAKAGLDAASFRSPK